HDQHVIVAGRDALEPFTPDFSQLSLDLVALHRAPDRARHREAEPGRGCLLPREPVENEEARGNRPALTVDGLEVPAPGQAVRALHSTSLVWVGLGGFGGTVLVARVRWASCCKNAGSPDSGAIGADRGRRSAASSTAVRHSHC